MPIIEEFDLTGKIALIAADDEESTPYLAEAMAEAGANLFVIAPKQELIDQSVRRAKERGVEAHGTLRHCSREDDVDSALVDTLDRYGRVDILVNNFNTQFAKPFDQVSLSEYDTVMDRNAKSVFLTCRAVGKGMVEQGSGRIINIISGLAERGMLNSAAYCASQGAVLQLTRVLALEWGRYNIRVNAIGAGWSSIEELSPEDAQKELLVRYVPLRRKGHPRDIAPLLVYLASDSCDYTTGNPVYVDGGLMAHP